MPGSSRSQIASNFTAERAVSQVREAVLNGVVALFREQTTSDFGIDAQVELVRDEQPSGQLVALQIKGGASAFRSRADGGWYFPVRAKHATYWLSHSLPVVLVLANLETGKSHWQAVNADTLQSTGKGFKVFVPAANVVSSAQGDWEDLAAARFHDVEALYAANLQAIPLAAAQRITSLRDEGHLRAAQALAGDLAAGRSRPASALSELVGGRSAWLDRFAPHSWRALGEYAREHKLFDAAADAFLRLAELCPEHRASHIADAALCLVDVDNSRAGKLLADAANEDPDHSVVLVVKATLGGPSDEAHAQLANRTDAAARSYLAHHAIRLGDMSTAIVHLSLLPENVRSRDSLQTLNARLRTSRALTAEGAPDDLDIAHELARQGLTSRRMWTDDTADALAVFARVLAVEFQHGEVLEQTAPYPHGSASMSEAADVDVAVFALRAAAEQGRLDVIDDIVAAVENDDDRDYVAAEAKLLTAATDDEHISHNQNVLSRAIEVGDRQRAFDAAVQLAVRAVDESAQLTHVGLEERYIEQIRLIARATEDPKANLKHLRALATTEILAAEIVVRILLETGAKEAAAEACELYYSVYSLPSFLLTKGRAQIQADDIESAAKTFERVLATHPLSGEPYVDTHTFLGEYHGSKGSWEISRDHFIAVLAKAPKPKRSVYWNLLRCHIEMTDFAAARRLVDERYTAPETDDEIRVWGQIMVETGWTDTSASLAVTIARRKDTDPELAAALVGNIVKHTRGPGDLLTAEAERDEPAAIDLRPEVSACIHREAFAVLDGLASTVPGEFPFFKLEAEPEELIGQIRAMLGQRDMSPVRAMMRQINRGIVPFGALCLVRNDSYSALLAGRGTDPRMASHPDASVHEKEASAAREARNRRVVVDLSAIELAHHLDSWAATFGEFNVVLIPTLQDADAKRGVMEARSATAEGGSLALTASGELYMTRRDPALQILTLQRTEQLEIASRQCLSIDVGSDITINTEVSKLKMSAWLSSVELAWREGVPLWSDDVAQRRLAASLGIPTFGTVNLLESHRLEALESATDPQRIDELLQEQHRFVLDLIERRVVDQPVSLDDVRSNIAANPGVIAPAATSVARAAWWRSTEMLSRWSAVLSSVRAHAPDYARQWQSAAIAGLTDAVPDERAPQAAAALAAYGTEAMPQVADVVEGFRLADEMLAERLLPPASDHVAWAVSSLTGRLAGADPEEFARAVSEELSTLPSGKPVSPSSI